MTKKIYFLFLVFLVFACGEKQPEFVVKADQQLREIKMANIAPDVDGIADDPTWQDKTWYPIDQRWLGKKYKEDDFSGRFKLTWTPDALYVLAEITDDKLYDAHENPLERFWDDDCLEIFVDEDNSGGDHQYNYSAFAYHVALDGNVVDTAENGNAQLFNNHVFSQRKTTGNTTIWEARITIFDKDFNPCEPYLATDLKPDKKMGFAIAYCDNDGSTERENFIGSLEIKGKDKNRGWIDAGVFGTLFLVE